jgi:hypothetical protein
VGDEIERGTDAEQADAGKLIEATRSEDLLSRSAQRNKTEPCAGRSNFVDRSVGLL